MFSIANNTRELFSFCEIISALFQYFTSLRPEYKTFWLLQYKGTIRHRTVAWLAR